MAHAYGCAFEFLTATAVGAHITFLGKTPSPQILLKAFSDIKPSVIFSVPLILEKIYKKQILPIINKKEIRILLKVPILNQIVYTKIRRKLTDAFGGSFSQVIVGGAPLNKEVEDFLLKIKFPITVGYGMPECAPLISFSVYTEFTPSSAGKVLDTMQVKILSADPCQEVGEICVKGENLMLGYYKNEDATKEIIDEQGWLHTGDLGLLAKNGTVFIKGRSKSLILSPSGQNIYPEEIESKLNNMPYISESIVVQNDGKLIALVFLDKDMLDSENISSDNILMLMQNNLKELNNVVAHYEKISEIKIHPTEFEKTPKKSIKRFLYNA
jgi:long-chain acyl-CoA synthetase